MDFVHNPSETDKCADNHCQHGKIKRSHTQKQRNQITKTFRLYLIAHDVPSGNVRKILCHSSTAGYEVSCLAPAGFVLALNKTQTGFYGLIPLCLIIFTFAVFFFLIIHLRNFFESGDHLKINTLLRIVTLFIHAPCNLAHE